jgi:uncharacterized protein YbjT (DUF2867 family)
MKVILFGSTGMIGQGTLQECLKDKQVEEILVVNRQSCGVTDTKLTEIIHPDFYDLSSISTKLTGYDTCLYCLGISSVGMAEADYHRITYDLTIYIAETLLSINKDMNFCYISGANTDSTEKGKSMWARVKGKTENALLAMPFKNVYMLRPGFIEPLKGIKSKTPLYQFIYTVFKPLFFILRNFENIATNTETLGKAMILAAANGYEKPILESRDINEIVK